MDKTLKNSRWKPETRQSYWYIDNDGALMSTVCTNSLMDKKHYDEYNCFKTKVDAEFALSLYSASDTECVHISWDSIEDLR